METPRIPRGVREGWNKEGNFRVSDREVRSRDRPGCRMADKCLDPTLERAPEQRLTLLVARGGPFLQLHGTVSRKAIFKNLRHYSRVYAYHRVHVSFVHSEKCAILGLGGSNLFGPTEVIKRPSIAIFE